jgi:hypothetical protein
LLLPVWASEPPSLFSGLGVAVGGMHDGVAAGVIAGVVSAGGTGAGGVVGGADAGGVEAGGVLTGGMEGGGDEGVAAQVRVPPCQAATRSLPKTGWSGPSGRAAFTPSCLVSPT